MIVEQPIFLGGAPAIGFGQEALIAPAAAAASDPSPWALTFAGSVLAAATGWALDEFARTVRERRRQ